MRSHAYNAKQGVGQKSTDIFKRYQYRLPYQNIYTFYHLLFRHLSAKAIWPLPAYHIVYIAYDRFSLS
jgi:hypothetical protein